VRLSGASEGEEQERRTSQKAKRKTQTAKPESEEQIKRQSAKREWQSFLLLPFAFCALPFDLFFRLASRRSA